jgi:DNA-binding GntR family transcriptional regulator
VESPAETAAILEGILARQKHVVSQETYDLFDMLDKDFHRVLYERAGILGLWSTVRRQSVHLDRLRMLNLPMPGKLEQIIIDHQAVVDAVRSANAEAAVAALRRHLSGTLSIVDLICEQYPDYVSR